MPLRYAIGPGQSESAVRIVPEDRRRPPAPPAPGAARLLAVGRDARRVDHSAHGQGGASFPRAPVPRAVDLPGIAARWLCLTQTQLSRIETGPAPDSLVKLTSWARTLGVPPDLLWFEVPGARSGSSWALVPHEREDQETAWLIDSHGNASGVIPVDPGAAGRERWRDDMHRRELLRLLCLAGPSVVIDGPDSDGRTRSVDGSLLAEYAALNSHLWRAFVLSRSKAAVLPLVRSHLDTLVDCLRRSNRPESHRELCVLIGELFQLAGEVYFDLNRYADAAQCYTMSATACREADALDLWACALTRHAFIGIHEGRYDSAASLLELAVGLAQRGDGSLATSHWVAAVRAQAFAGLRQPDLCSRALDFADGVRDLPGTAQNGGWLRFDGSRLAEERGACYVSSVGPSWPRRR